MSIRFINNGKSGGGSASLNIFTGLAEPEKKKGIWLKKNISYNNVINENNLYLSPEWNTEKMENMATPSWSTAYCSIVTDGKDLYYMGSSTYKGFYKYDKVNNTYIQLTDLPFNKMEAMAVANSNHIICLGRNTTPRGDCIIDYNIEENSFNSYSSNIFNTFIEGYCLILYNNLLFIIGGKDTYNNTQIYKTQILKYDISLKTSSIMSTIPYEFLYGSTVVIDDNIYLIGGTNSLRKVYKYNINEDTFTEMTDLTFDFSNGTATVIGKEIYLFANSKYYKYNVETGTSILLGDMPRTFTNHGNLSTFFNNSIYVFQAKNNILDFPFKTFTPNSIILSQNENKFNTELIDTEVENGLQYGFNNVGFSDENGELDDTIETYYGNGTGWIKFKN